MKDKSKKIKKIMIFLIIICAVLLVIKLKLPKEEEKLSEIEIIDGAYSFEMNKVRKVSSRNDYCLVKECVEKFYDNYIKNKDIYSFLDDEYIDKFNIQRDNLNGKYGKFEGLTIDITKMYASDIGLGVTVYFVYGNLIDIKTSNTTDLAIAVKIDSVNKTFSILPYEYLEKDNYLNIKEGTNTKFKETTEIKNKESNTFLYSNVNDKIYIDYLFKNYINRCMNNIELVYESLDNNYKQKRFGNLEEFQKFVEENKTTYMYYDLQNLKTYNDFDNMDEYLLYLDRVKPLEIKSYQRTTNKEYTQYVLIDNLNRYYIFRETAPMEYKLFLDSYTIDLPEFVGKYLVATTEEKVGMNIEKIVEALNSKDYKYVYSKLASEFKTNYFKTYEEFEKYAKKTFLTGYNIKFDTYTESKNLSTYEIILTREKSSKEITKTIVMKLKDGTDFVMSFNVE